MNSKKAYLALNLVPGLGPIKVRRLLDRFTDAVGILEAPFDELLRVQGVGPELAKTIRDWENRVDLEAELELLERRQLDFIARDDPRFPVNLKEIYDPPLGLYVWGELQERDRHAIAVVGSRRCTHYGLQTAKKLSFQMAHAGITVLSGLARGIDTAAHEGALASGGRTIAVIGSGLAQVYPPENLPLAQRIADGHGAVVSEFPLNWGPNKTTFPLRNRIVSGWSRGVLVVEAAERSGALITANLAAEQGRSLFAVPGPIDRETSAGCNRLIQDGARLVMDGGDILTDFQQLPFEEAAAEADSDPTASTPPKSIAPAPDLAADEIKLIEVMGQEQHGVDELIELTGLGAAQVTTALLTLELKRQIQALPGSRYVRI